jgi:ATP-dependent Lon protease
MISPIFLTNQEDIDAATFAMEKNSLLLLTTTKEGLEGSRKSEDINKIGVIGSIMRKVHIPDGRVKILFQGLAKGEIVSDIERIEFDELSFMSSMINLIKNKTYNELKTQALIGILNEKLQLLSKIHNNIPQDLLKTISETDEPYRTADLVSSLLKISKTEAYNIYKEQNIEQRLMHLIDIIVGEIESAKIEREIRSKVHNKIEQTNKEYFLKEQIKEINKELGLDAQREEEIVQFRKKLEAIKPHIEEETHKEIKKQIDRFARMHPDSGDANQIHTYLDWVFELPFGKLTSKTLQVTEVQQELDNDHYSLVKPKERIVEFFSVRELAQRRGISLDEGASGTILCFYGPPGVGKTSLANSIANALARPLVRIALGGLEDVNELRGHRRTYVGAMPGRVVQGIIDAKSMNPVIVLDEVDKVGRSHKGDPTAVLLEILDPEQNSKYRDYYLNFNIDLSRVIFIATANDLGGIPAPLRDRMEFISVSSYTPDEKLEIAKQYLIPQELKKHALADEEFLISDEALKLLIDEYTREPGVRGLRRKIAGLMRKSATALLADESLKTIELGVEDLAKYADKKVFEVSRIDKEPLIGVVNGLAWTSVGGDVLKIEAIKIKGKGVVQLTGSLGDVMKESAHIAFSVVKILIDNKSLKTIKKYKKSEDEIYKLYDLHIHVPEGATPKDGPSAGVTMAVAIASILSEKKVDNQVAMTGELTLTGKILPIGGLKEKLIAAYKAGVTKALIPQKNFERDLEDIPQEVRDSVKIIAVLDINDILSEVLL